MSLAFCLQTYGTSTGKGDARAAVELCELIADMEDISRGDCYFMIVYRKDTPMDLINTCLMHLRGKFKAEAFAARNYATGHPYGSNMLWSSAIAQIGNDCKDKKKFPYSGVLTFESDCVPMRKDWISALTNEWNTRVIMAGEWDEDEDNPEHGKVAGWPKYEVMGHADHEHINGNMILRPDIMTRHPELMRFTSEWGWDHMNGKRYLKLGVDTNLIYQHYKRASISRAEIPFITKHGTVPALYHGVQGPVGKQARRLIRDILIDGVPV